MDETPYKPKIAQYKIDYSVLNTKRVKMTYRQMFADIDDHYYEEYSNLESELVLMGIPRHCLDHKTFWEGIFSPKSLLDWSIHSLPLAIKNKIFNYLSVVRELPSEFHCLHDDLIYRDHDGNKPEINIFEPPTAEEVLEKEQRWEEFRFRLNVSYDEYEMSLEINMDE